MVRSKIVLDSMMADSALFVAFLGLRLTTNEVALFSLGSGAIVSVTVAWINGRRHESPVDELRQFLVQRNKELEAELTDARGKVDALEAERGLLVTQRDSARERASRERRRRISAEGRHPGRAGDDDESPDAPVLDPA